MITFIYGDRASGKTEKVKELTKGKNVVTLYEEDLEKKYLPISNKTECIIIEGLVGLHLLDRFLQAEFILNLKGKELMVIKTPDIYVIFQTNANKTDKIEFIDCGRKKEFNNN